MTNRILGQYVNGNYSVKIYMDGTKIRETMEDDFIPEFPESMDLKITNYCNLGCLYCHEDSTVSGKHGDILNMKFIDTIQPYTEIAIGGGNPLAHPNLTWFLMKLKERSIIPSITVNLKHLFKDSKKIDTYVNNNMIYGLGVSISEEISDEVLELIDKYPNLVLHVINGIISVSELKKLYKTKAKVLILGYKQFRRGNDYYNEEVENKKLELKNNILDVINNINVASFDNLALTQLDMKSILPPKFWDQFYMGDDGKYTMYIDAVNQVYTSSSVTDERFALQDDIKDMFKHVRSLNTNDIKFINGSSISVQSEPMSPIRGFNDKIDMFNNVRSL